MTMASHDLYPKIVFNCPPSRRDRLHPCVHKAQDQRTRENTHQRRIQDINKIVIFTGVCRMNLVLEDSKQQGIQKHHAVIDKNGAVYILIPPDRYVSNREWYRVFLEGDFEHPMPVVQREALRFVLNAFEGMCKSVPVFLQSELQEVRSPGPFLDMLFLTQLIFPVDWGTDKETWVET